jgi:hypothetical protein
MTGWQIGTATRGIVGIWNGWRDITPQSSAIACTGHVAARGLTTLADSC